MRRRRCSTRSASCLCRIGLSASVDQPRGGRGGDIAEATAARDRCRGGGRYTRSETELFRMDTGRSNRRNCPRLRRKRCRTGRRRHRGAARSVWRRALFAANGAEVALLDVHERNATETAAALGAAAQGIACDVTDRLRHARFRDHRLALGGVDILVSNAGAACRPIGEVDDAVLRKSFSSISSPPECRSGGVKSCSPGTGAPLFTSRNRRQSGANFVRTDCRSGDAVSIANTPSSTAPSDQIECRQRDRIRSGFSTTR